MAKTKSDKHYELMKKAIEMMMHSKEEPRSDGKVSPLVGAIILKPDGSIESAYRGELRHGEHAEFTLLDKKLRNEKLDASILFATLEPCAPGARNHPKLSCSERIINARIKEVWVGIEDPDPVVDRQGIHYMEEHGIKVHLFPPDLQKHITKANKKFIKQALQRTIKSKDKQKKKVSVISLSQWDDILDGVDINDLDKSALSKYKSRSKIQDQLLSPEFNKHLIRQGFLRYKGRKALPTGFGFLLFGKKPREVLHQSGVNATIEYPDGEEEIKTFDGPTIMIPQLIENWLNPKLPQIVDRTTMVRKEKKDLPFKLIRESVINALVHRDYDLTSATCQIIVTPDTIKVRSPGEPLAPITLQQLQVFKAPMYNRNPKLQFAFGLMKLVEGRGLGMKTLASATTKFDLPTPQFDFDGVYLNLTIYRHSIAAVEAIDNNILKKLIKPERTGLEFILKQKETTQSTYAKHMEIGARTAQRHLAHFVDLGLLKRIGKGKATKYIKS